MRYMLFGPDPVRPLNVMTLFSTHTEENKKQIANATGWRAADFEATRQAHEVALQHQLVERFAPAFYFPLLEDGFLDVPFDLDQSNILQRFELWFVPDQGKATRCFARMNTAILAKSDAELREMLGVESIPGKFVLQPNPQTMMRDPAWNSRLPAYERGSHPAVYAYVKGYEGQNHIDIVYSIIYPYNGSQRLRLSSHASSDVAICRVEGLAHHYGDVEAVTVRVMPDAQGYRLWGAAFHSHGACVTGWHTESAGSERIAAYVMRGSHAIWPAAGSMDRGVLLTDDVKHVDDVVTLHRYQVRPVDWGTFPTAPMLPPDYRIYNVTLNFLKILNPAFDVVVNVPLIAQHNFDLGLPNSGPITSIVHEQGARELSDVFGANPFVELIEAFKIPFKGGAPKQAFHQEKLQHEPLVLSRDMMMAILSTLIRVDWVAAFGEQEGNMLKEQSAMLWNALHLRQSVSLEMMDSFYRLCASRKISVELRWGEQVLRNWEDLPVWDRAPNEEKSELILEVWHTETEIPQCLSRMAWSERFVPMEEIVERTITPQQYLDADNDFEVISVDHEVVEIQSHLSSSSASMSMG